MSSMSSMSSRSIDIGEIGENEIVRVMKCVKEAIVKKAYQYHVKPSLFECVRDVIQKMIDKNDSIGLRKMETYLSFDRFYTTENVAMDWLLSSFAQLEYADEYILPIINANRQKGGLSKITYYHINENENNENNEN